MAEQALNVPLTLSFDTRGVASWTAIAAGKDQIRKNCHYEITRTSVDTQPDIALAKRPGVTVNGTTFGSTAQVGYLLTRDPASSWDPIPWVIVKESGASKVISSATSITILSDATYYPRFVDTTDISGTRYAIVQLQNDVDPAATPAQKTYYAASVNGWAAIAATAYTALSHRGKMEFMDGYAFQMDSRHRIYQSTINGLSAWSDVDYLTKSSQQDAAQGLIKSRSQILAFGTETVEIFRNDGNATGSVLGRLPNSEHRIGLAAVAGGGTSMAGKTNYYAKVGDLVFFCGRYGGSKYDTSLIAYDGNRFEKISRPYEDTLLSTTTLYSVNPFSFHGKIAVAVQFTAPTATTQQWLMFFPDINEMFIFESTVYGPVNNGLHFLGSSQSNRIYEFDASDTFADNGTNYTMLAQFKLPFSDLRWKTMTKCGLIADTTASSSNLAVSFIDDDSGTPGTARNIDLSLKRKELVRCGTFRERFVKLTSTDSKEVRLRRFYASMM